MNDNAEMKVTYIDPDRKALYAGETPDGGFTVWTQKDKAAPRKLISSNYIKPDGYATLREAQSALSLYVSNKRDGASWAMWEVFVNGKQVTFEEYAEMVRGELAAPQSMPPAAMVTLANIEYRIATHIQGAYDNLLEVGRCLIEAKESGLVAHGKWEAWVRRNTNMSERGAQKLMQAARCVHQGSAMERLPISKIQAILALPEPERESMAEKADKESMSLRELQEAIKAEKARADAMESSYKKAIRDKDEAYRRHTEEMDELGNAIDQLVQEKSAEAIEKADEKVIRYKLEAEKAAKLAGEKVNTVLELRKQLEEAKREAPAAGISPEAQAEIDRLKAEIAEAEEYAEKQASERQQAQREMLAAQSQAARGASTGTMLCVDELVYAVRTFIGTAGVVPLRGAQFATLNGAERTECRQYVEMVATWVDGARKALDTVLIDGEGV